MSLRVTDKSSDKLRAAALKSVRASYPPGEARVKQMRTLGFFPTAEDFGNSRASALVPKTVPSNSRSGVRTRVGPFVLDSKTEARIYERLVDAHPLVMVKGKIAMADEVTLGPDFTVISQINRTGEPQWMLVQPGHFVGNLADAKGLRAKKRGGKKRAHEYDDFRAKRLILETSKGAKIELLTEGDVG